MGGCIDGNDDFGGVGASQVEGLEIAPGQALVIVASTFSSDSAIGPYTLDVLTLP